MPYLRDGVLFYNKQGHYALGATPLVALFKDARCTRFFAPADDPLAAVFAVDEANGFRTLEGAAVPRSDDAVLAVGSLARAVLTVAPDGAVSAAFDAACSAKRALPDTASKVAFYARHRVAPLSIDAVKAAAAGGGGASYSTL